MTTYTRYAIEITKGHQSGWLVVVYDDAGFVMDVTVTDDPFKATVYSEYIRARNIRDEIEGGEFNNCPPGATICAVTFTLRTD